MTSLMQWVRRTDVRRGIAGVAGATFVLALAGCDDDHANNADAKKPIAVTSSGIEIMEIVKHEDTRTVEAVVVAGGEERQVTLAPLLDGPLPFGMRATVTGSSGAGPIEQSYGWDENSASTWFRQQSDGLTFEFLRVTVQDRVVEEYAFNDRFLRLEYADLPVAIASKTIEKYLRGESLEGASADVVELAGELEEFEAFAAQLPSAPAASEDSALLTSLLGDPVFADAIVGEDVTPNRPDGLCKSFNLCVAFACRIIVNQYICGVCVAGSLACAFMDWFCYMWCGGGN